MIAGGWFELARRATPQIGRTLRPLVTDLSEPRGFVTTYTIPANTWVPVERWKATSPGSGSGIKGKATCAVQSGALASTCRPHADRIGGGADPPPHRLRQHITTEPHAVDVFRRTPRKPELSVSGSSRPSFAPSGGPIQRRSALPGGCAVVVRAAEQASIGKPLRYRPLTTHASHSDSRRSFPKAAIPNTSRFGRCVIRFLRWKSAATPMIIQ